MFKYRKTFGREASRPELVPKYWIHIRINNRVLLIKESLLKTKFRES